MWHFILQNWQGILFGSSALMIVSHAVNTFPTPRNPYGVWFLGVIQFAVGQRVIAKNTLQGLDTQTMGVMKVPNGK